MARPTSKKIKKQVTISELNNMISSETNKKMLIRLEFIKFLYDGASVRNASEKIGKSKPTGYTWLKNWNESGYNGLKMKHSSGRPSNLTENQQNEIKILLDERFDHRITFKIENLLKLIKDMYGIDYSPRQMIEIVKKWGYRYWERGLFYKRD